MPIAKLPKDSSESTLLPKRYFKDQEWTHEHLYELEKKYPDQWIAVYRKKVVAAGKDPGEFKKVAEAKATDGQCYYWFVQSWPWLHILEEDLLSMPKQYLKDQKWTRKRLHKLAKKYPDQWIAVYRKKVIVADEDLGEVEKIAEAKVTDGECYYCFVQAWPYVRKADVFNRQNSEASKDSSESTLLPKRYFDDGKWMQEHFHELEKKYPDQWIAVYRKEVVAAGKNLGEVKKIAKAKATDGQCYYWLVLAWPRFR